jgi:hypothetical protein
VAVGVQPAHGGGVGLTNQIVAPVSDVLYAVALLKERRRAGERGFLG